jgi:hypothetical protein
MTLGILEKVVKRLSLEERGFTPVEPDSDEIVRYQRDGHPAGIQVGIDRQLEDAEEPDPCQFYLNFDALLPEGTSPAEAEKMFPIYEQMEIFFRNAGIPYHDRVADKEDPMKLHYHIGFEKNSRSVKQMGAVLREFIEYTCHYLAVNIEMAEKAKALAE